MNDDDDPQSHFMFQSIPRFAIRGADKFVRIQFGDLDSNEFADEAGDQTCGLIESCIRLKFSIAHFNGLCNMIYYVYGPPTSNCQIGPKTSIRLRK